jgi:F-type H+-transporting ATPase subunit delta
MEEKAIEYGGKVFQLVFSDLMTGKLNRAFIDELVDALNEIEKGSIVVDSPEANVIVSHSLDPDQHKRLEAILKEKFHDKATLTESVDESLLGGLILKMGSLEIDGSLRNRYKEAVDEVKKGSDAAI